MSRLGLVACAAAGVALGLGAEWVGFGWDEPRRSIPDLATGWAFIAGGLVASARRPETRVGVLLIVAGFAWFAGNFAVAGWAWIAWIAAQVTYLHRGVLAHCVLAYPSGRLLRPLDRAVVGGAYTASVIPVVARSGAATAAVAAVVGACAVRGYLVARGRSRRARVPAMRAAALLAGVLAVGAGARLAFPAGDASYAVLLTYEVALCVVVVVLVGGLLRRSQEDRVVADLVVELGEERSGALRDGLARALGDPALEVGYWSPEAGGYVDASGRPVVLPESSSGRSVTVIERGAEPVAVLVHDPVALGDPALVDGISAAARLAAVNARLRAEVLSQLADLRASRRRLVEAGDDERRRLESELREGAERRLRELSATLARSRGRSVGPQTAERLALAEGRLARTLEDLRELARGLHPRVLSQEGLAGALASLAVHSVVPVDLSVPAIELPREVEVGLYFVCAEALANVAKHASASRVSVAITTGDGRLIARIADDGIGGAELAGGLGLRGLADRVETLGGTLRLDSPPAHGTRITVEIPLAEPLSRSSSRAAAPRTRA